MPYALHKRNSTTPQSVTVAPQPRSHAAPDAATNGNGMVEVGDHAGDGRQTSQHQACQAWAKFQDLRGLPGREAERACQARAKSATRAPLIHRHAARFLQPIHPAPAAPARACQPQAPTDPAQQRARRGSQCTHTNHTPECTPAPPHAAHCRAESERAAPSRRHTQTRAAPSKSRADHQKPTRSAREMCSPTPA